MAYGIQSTFTTQTIKPNVFWPELSLGDFQQDYKFPADYAIESVELTVKQSIFQILKEIAPKVAEWQAAGYQAIEDVPQAVVLDTYEYVANFQHAVFSLAKAKLFAQLVSMTRKQTSESLSEEAEKNIDYWQAESKRAVKSILGKTNISVETL